MFLYFETKIMRLNTKAHNFAKFNSPAYFNYSSMRLTTTRRGKSSWMNCLPLCRSEELQSTGCQLWLNKYLTCTSCTTWWWHGAGWWRSSIRNSGRRSSRVLVFHLALHQLHSHLEHSELLFNGHNDFHIKLLHFAGTQNTCIHSSAR